MAENFQSAFKTNAKPNRPTRHNTYKIAVAQLALAGVLLALTIAVALLSSPMVWPVPIPLINGRVDLWYGAALISVVMIRHWQYKLTYLASLILLIAPIEFAGSGTPNYADYALSMIVPLATLGLMAIPMPKKYNTWWRLGQTIAVIIIFSVVRLIFSSISGILFYVDDWNASVAYNAPNVFVDSVFMVFAIPLIFVKLKRFAPYI